MKAVNEMAMKTLVALAWCGMAVGCVAEEAKKLVMPQGNEAVGQANKTDSDSAIVTTSLDIKVENDELLFTDQFKDILFECGHDGPCVFVFDGLVVEFGPTIIFQEKYFEPRMKNTGKVYWPPGANTRTSKEYSGGKVEVYCKKTGDDDMSEYIKGATKIKSCSISSNPKYFIKFVE